MKTDLTAKINDQLFSSTFFNTLAEALTEACGCPWSIMSVPKDEAAGDESEPVRIKLTLDGSLCGELLLEFDRSETLVLVSRLLGNPADEIGEEQSEAVRAVTEKASIAFSGALQEEYGVFAITVSLAPSPAFNSSNALRVAATSDDGSRLSVVMRLDSALTESLSVHSQGESAAAGVGEAMVGDVEKKIPEPVNLDLVMDVELNVTLRFGKRHLSLREVLELTSGSVVELDRQVDEPVELLLNGKVIAKGEAVVIDGNYGLRVSEVLQPISSLVLN
jgi:flagellar motor switch protein FliN/FliY